MNRDPSNSPCSRSTQTLHTRTDATHTHARHMTEHTTAGQKAAQYKRGASARAQTQRDLRATRRERKTNRSASNPGEGGAGLIPYLSRRWKGNAWKPEEGRSPSSKQGERAWNSKGKKVGFWRSRKFLMFAGGRHPPHHHQHQTPPPLLPPFPGEHHQACSLLYRSPERLFLFIPKTKLGVRAALQTNTPASTFIF